MTVFVIISIIFSVISIFMSFMAVYYTQFIFKKFKKIAEPMKDLEKIIEVSKKILDVMPNIPTKEQLSLYITKYNELNDLVQKICIILKVPFEKLKNSTVYGWKMSDELIEKLKEYRQTSENE